MLEPTNNDILKRTAELLNENGYEARFQAAYSGRGMFCSTAPAIVTDAPPCVLGVYSVQAVHDLTGGVEDLETCCALAEAAAPNRWDHLGLSRVYY